MVTKADVEAAWGVWRAAQGAAREELAGLLHVDSNGIFGFDLDDSGTIWIETKVSFMRLRVRVGRVDLPPLRRYEIIGKLFPIASWEGRPELARSYEKFLAVKGLYEAARGVDAEWRKTPEGLAETEKDRRETIAEFEAKQEKIPGTGWWLFPGRADRLAGMSTMKMSPGRIDEAATASLARAALRARTVGDLESAVRSAGYYAKKTQRTMYVYYGNSYGWAVWRVSDKPGDYLNRVNNMGTKLASVTSELVVSWHDLDRGE